MPQNAFVPRNRDLLASQKTTQRHFPHTPSPFHGNICNCNSGGICTASQFQVQLPLLYTAWNNAYSEIGPEVTLRPMATSCAKDYKGHSLVQTSFTETPNSLPTKLDVPYAVNHNIFMEKTVPLERELNVSPEVCHGSRGSFLFSFLILQPPMDHLRAHTEANGSH